MSQRPRLAYFSPLPPAPSGIADYSRELLPPLARLADVALFVERPDDVNASVAPEIPIFPRDGSRIG